VNYPGDHPQLLYQPTVYVGSFVLPLETGNPTDTFANMCGWFKVLIFSFVYLTGLLFQIY